MKLTFFSVFLLLSVYTQAHLTVSGQIKGVHQPQILLINSSFDCWYYKELSQPVHTDKNGNFSLVINVQSIQNIFIEYHGQRMLLYVEPGKNVSLSFDSSDLIHSIRFQGPLKIENDFRSRIGLSYFTINPKEWNDSLSSPHEIVASIKKSQESALKQLNGLRKTTSEAFQSVTKSDINYFLAGVIWNFIFRRNDALKKDKPAWQAALRNAYQQQPLSNPDAIKSYYYQNMIAYYPQYLELVASDEKALDSMLEAVLKKPAAKALQEIKDKGKRFWKLQAFISGLQGAALEYAMASFIDNGVHLGELDYLQEAYADFSFRFPKSTYRSYINQIMSVYLSSESIKAPEDIIFEPDSVVFSKLGKILEQHKGRVLYIDLWGSWCGPCKEEFAYNRQLKAHFKDKPVDFLYIAFEHNRGKPEAIWKKTVRFYHLTGRHILAGDTLKADIGKLYGPEGVNSFPSYMLIDKDGMIQNLFAERPSSADKLYMQIEQLLK